jgi:hypothetical protein
MVRAHSRKGQPTKLRFPPTQMDGAIQLQGTGAMRQNHFSIPLEAV